MIPLPQLPKPILFYVLLLLVSSISLPAVSQESSSHQASQYYENAIQYYNNENYDASIIELKNALQINSRLLPAIVLLGETYLKKGNFAAAETAFSDAIAAGADIALVAIPRAKALILQFKHELLIAEEIPSGLPDDILSELLNLKAQAAIEINNQEAVTKAISASKAVNPDNIDLLFLEITLALQDDNFLSAEELLVRMQRLYPQDRKTLMAEASTSHKKSQLSKALNEYSRLIDQYPDSTDARLARVEILFNTDQGKQTLEDLEYLQTLSPLDPRINFLTAKYYSLVGDQEKQREYLQTALEVLNSMNENITANNQQFSLVGGMSNFELGNDESALVYLENYVNSGGGDLGARLALAKLYSRFDDYKSAVYVAESILEEGVINIDLIDFLTSTYQKAGTPEKAVNLLEQATSLFDNAVGLNIQLALSRIQSGYVEQGLSELEALHINRDNQKLTTYPLAISYLQLNRFERAYQVALQLLDNKDTALSGHNLMGLSEVGRGNLKAARQQFEQIIARQPDNLAAHINIAKLDVRESNPEKALARLNPYLKQHPENAQLALELSRTYQAMGNSRDAITWARQAYKLDNSLSSARQLVGLLMAADNQNEANQIVLALEDKSPEDLDALELSVDTLIAQQEENQAKSQLRNMVTIADSNPEWLIRIARKQANTGSLDEATYTLFKALQSIPDHLEAHILLTELEIDLNRLDSAEDRIQNLVATRPNNAVVQLLRGNLYKAKGDLNKALNNYSQAYNLSHSSEILQPYYSTQMQLGQTAAAEKNLIDWLDNNPNDDNIRGALAEHYLLQNEPDKAKQQFQMLVDKGINNARLFNNMANVLLKLNQLDSALSYARQAVELNPDNAYNNDTLGWLLTLLKQPEKGISYLREAQTRASNNPEIQYHLAANLIAQQRTAEAIRVLKSALSQNDQFEGRDEAQKLLLQLE